MAKWSLGDHEIKLLPLITSLIFHVAFCQLPNTPTYRSLIFNNIGIKLCQLKCAENGFCRSIEYTISTLTCHLSELDHDTITNEAQHFVGSKDLADVRGGSCQLNTCPNMRCLETRTGKTECVKEKWNHSELNTTLLDACTVGDLARTKTLLSEGQANINSMGSGNMTPVMHAAKAGHREVFDLLVREGANLSLVDHRNRNILFFACFGGNVEIVRYVLEQNIASINSRDMDRQTPAMNAALYTRQDVFDLLVEAGADLLLVDDFKQTILHVACQGGNVEIVKAILTHHTVDINSRTMSGWTPAMYAVSDGQKDVFDVLVEEGVDLSQVSNDKESILHMACGGGNVEIVKYLLTLSVLDIDNRDIYGRTPVMHAVSKGRKGAFDVLVEAGADLSLITNGAETLLHSACRGGNVGILKYLLKHGVVDIDSQDVDGWTPVMHAVNAGHKDALAFLVEQGADLLLVNNDKETILHVVCDSGSVEIIKYLLKLGIVDIDSRDINGWTPVMRAASVGQKDVFDVLVEAGADLSQVGNKKETILHVSCKRETVEIIKYLLTDEIVDIDSRDINGWTPAMRAASEGRKDVFDVLVEAGADLSLVSTYNETILHVSCENGNVEIIKYLLKHDIVDIDSRNMDGWTPIMQATCEGHKDVFDVLVKGGADLSLLDENNANILHLACYHDSLEIIKQLLTDKLVDINSRDGDDCTAAMIAARRGDEAVFNVLVENGADLTITNNVGDNILNMACDGENVQIVKYVSTRHIVEGPYREDDPC